MQDLYRRVQIPLFLVPCSLSWLQERAVRMSTISNSEAIAAWSAMPADAVEFYDDQGDYPMGTGP